MQYVILTIIALVIFFFYRMLINKHLINELSRNHLSIGYVYTSICRSGQLSSKRERETKNTFFCMKGGIMKLAFLRNKMGIIDINELAEHIAQQIIEIDKILNYYTYKEQKELAKEYRRYIDYQLMFSSLLLKVLVKRQLKIIKSQR